MNKIFTFGIINYLSLLSYIEGFGLPKEKTWSFEAKSIECKTVDRSLFYWDLHLERVSRGVYSISGTLNMNVTIVEGDNNNILAKSYRSSNGDGNFILLPFQIPPMHMHKYMNTFYKETVMDTFKICSDMPTFEDKFVPPFERKVYTLTKCKFSTDGFPNFLQPGFYKVVLLGRGDADWDLELVVEVIPEF